MSRSNSRSNLQSGGQLGLLFRKRESITDAKGRALYDPREKSQAVTAYKSPSVSRRGIFSISSPSKASSAREALLKNNVLKSLPSYIFIINERVKLPSKNEIDCNSNPELLDDTVSFECDYFPKADEASLIQYANIFYKIFSKHPSLTDPQIIVDESKDDLAILKGGLRYRFKQLRIQIGKLRYSLGDTIKVRAMLEQALKLKKFIDVLDDLGVEDIRKPAPVKKPAKKKLVDNTLVQPATEPTVPDAVAKRRARTDLKDATKKAEQVIKRAEVTEATAEAVEAVEEAASAVKKKAEDPCPPQSGGDLETSEITEDQLRNVVRKFAFVVLQSIHPNPNYTKYQTINPVELVTKLNEIPLDETKMTEYVKEVGKLPPLIATIINNSNVNKESVLTKMIGSEKRKLLDMLIVSLMKSLADGSKSELNVFIQQNTALELDDQFSKIIQWISDKIIGIEKSNDESAEKIKELENHQIQLESNIKALKTEKTNLNHQIEVITTSEAQLRSSLASVASTLSKNPINTDGEIIQHKAIIQELQGRIQEIEGDLTKANRELREVQSAIVTKQDGTVLTQGEYTTLLTNLQTLEEKLGNKQSGGGPLTPDQEILDLKSQVGSLEETKKLASSANPGRDFQKEINELEMRIQTLESEKAEAQKNRGTLYTKVEQLADKLINGTNEEDIYRFLTQNKDSGLKHTDADPLVTLYSRIKEREKSIMLETQSKSKRGSLPMNEFCYLSFFVSFFIKELFFTKNSEDAENNSKLIHDILIDSVDKEYSENLLNEIFKALKENTKETFQTPFTLDSSEYPNLSATLLKIDTDMLTAGSTSSTFSMSIMIGNLYKSKFNGFYNSVNGIEFINDSSVTIPYITLFTYFIFMARKYLVSVQGKFTKCPLNSFLNPSTPASISKMLEL